MTIILIILIVGFSLVSMMVLTAIRNKGSMDPSESRSSRDAMKILDERFARGEIDEAEYTRKKTVLRH